MVLSQHLAVAEAAVTTARAGEFQQVTVQEDQVDLVEAVAQALEETRRAVLTKVRQVDTQVMATAAATDNLVGLEEAAAEPAPVDNQHRDLTMVAQAAQEEVQV